MADLITLQEYKTAEGITAPKDDARLNVLIPSVSELVKTYCGNSFIDFFSSLISDIQAKIYLLLL